MDEWDELDECMMETPLVALLFGLGREGARAFRGGRFIAVLDGRKRANANVNCKYQCQCICNIYLLIYL